MEYKVTMTVRILEDYASIQDFERALDMFNNANKGVIEIVGVEKELLRAYSRGTQAICQVVMEFLKGVVPMPSLGTITSIGEIYEVEWCEKGENAGSIFVTTENPRVVGFKRLPAN